MQGTTKYVILGLLTEMPRSGYEIKQLIDLRFRFFWSESYGQIYPELQRLEQAGLVAAGAGTTRGKRSYAITAAGREALSAWLEQPVEKESVRLELLLRMYFAALAPAATTVAHVETFRDTHARDLDLLLRFRDELERIPDPHHDHGHILRVIDFGIRTNEAYLAWAQDAIQSLKGPTRP